MSSAELALTGGLSLGDNVKAKFGAGDDLQIYHNGSSSIIEDVGTGNLLIRGSSSVSISDDAGYKFLNCVDEGNGGYVLLNHQNNAEKLRTTSTGIDVTGTATMDGLSVYNSGSGDAEVVIRTSDSSNDPVLKLKEDTAAIRFTIRSDESDNAKVKFQTNNTEVTRLAIDQNGDISFYEDTGTTPKFFWDASAERLGLGTSSPSFALDVQYAGDVVIQARTTANSVGNDAIFRASLAGASAGDAYIQFDIDSVGGYALGIDNSDSDKFKLTRGGPATPSSGTTLLTVDTIGNVGIGTSSPLAPIQVSSANGDFNTTYNSFAGVSAFLSNNGSAIQNTLGGAIAFDSPDGNGSKHAAISPVITGTDNNQVGLSFYVHPSATRSASIAEAMRIDSSGNVGIGTTSPDQTLHVHKASAGTVSSSSNSVLTLENSTTAILQFLTPNTSNAQIRFGDPQDNGIGYIQYNHTDNALQFGTNGPEKMRITSAGNVGIGTASPQSYYSGADNLVVYASGSSGITIATGDTTSTMALKFADGTDSTSENVGYIDYAHSDNSMRFGTSASERMRIDSSGNVGIGTSSTTEALTVYGNKKHLSNHGYGSNYTHIKYVSGDQPQTAVTFQIPATKCFIGIEMFFINSRIPGSNPSTSRIGRKYFTIARNGSGNDVVLDQGYGDDWTALSTSVGGAYSGGSGATTIVRTGSEANTATQGVKITFAAGNPSYTGGYGVLKFDILSIISDSTGFSIT
jgi:hypothetical protein